MISHYKRYRTLRVSIRRDVYTSWERHLLIKLLALLVEEAVHLFIWPPLLMALFLTAFLWGFNILDKRSRLILMFYTFNSISLYLNGCCDLP